MNGILGSEPVAFDLPHKAGRATDAGKRLAPSAFRAHGRSHICQAPISYLLFFAKEPILLNFALTISEQQQIKQ